MTHNASDKNSNLQWQLDAVSDVLGELTVTISDSLTVGRGADNDLVLGSKQVSREHAKLYVVNGQLYIKDLQSSNGTFINEVALTAHKSANIKAEDMVAFANFKFQATQTRASTDAVETTLPTTAAQTAEPIAEDMNATAQPTATRDKPATPVNPIVDDVADTATEAPSAQPPSAVKPTTDAKITEAKADAKQANQDSTIIKPVVQNPQSTSTKAEAPVNPLDTSADSDFEKQNTNKVDSTESVDTKEVLNQDKTTKTTLQQEANPDVQHAKQAATGQFAPAENNDIGINDNKAVDQAATNPATHPEQQNNKKSSGGWFIWVFLLIIVIAIVVWILQGGTA